MKSISLLLLTTLVLHAQPVFLGTGADGIYRADFNAETGTISQPELAAKYKSPGFLAMHPEKPILYSIGGDNKVAAFSIAKDYSLTLLGDAPCGGKGPCHLAIDASGRTLAVANYGEGSLTTIRLDADGIPGDIVTKIKLQGNGPNQQRQKEAHTHGVYFDNANRFLFAPDLGIDKVMIYKFDPATSELTPNDPTDFKIAPGAGPRHMTFSPDEKHAYVINELTSTVTVATYNPADGRLTEIQTVPTLPADFKGNSTTAEIEVHPNGKFVYGSNRGHDSIVVYKRDPATGKLTLLQHAPCGGNIPRHFKIDPSGKWLLCGHQKSNTLSILSLDPETGMLGKPVNTVSTPAPICILFP
jgi:6-phosphogluconolactonase